MGTSRDLTKIPNKIKRREQHVKVKKAKESVKRDERLKRRRTEDKNPNLRQERRAANVPATIDSKRKWDDAEDGAEHSLSAAIDLSSIKRRRVEDDKEADEAKKSNDDSMLDENDKDDDDADSMLDEDSGNEDEDKAKKSAKSPVEAKPVEPTTTTTTSTATDMDSTPESLQARFPTLFEDMTKEPKVLLTTSINSKLHHEAELMTELFPNSDYVRRTAHFHGHKYSVREIAKFASNRDYTALVILNEDLKKPSGLDVVHLPDGPMFHFSISNWIEGKRLPGHGNATRHYPELILNGFKTPLGLLTAHLFKTMFPPQPEHHGRQVVTLHNQRDYIFLRRHRYVFRDKRATEKSIVGTDGKTVKGVEEIRTGLQELGPRFTLKLRRIDRGIQRATGQEWEWKPAQEKVRTRFQL